MYNNRNNLNYTLKCIFLKQLYMIHIYDDLFNVHTQNLYNLENIVACLKTNLITTLTVNCTTA